MFSNALKQEWGSKKFLGRIRAASQGEYTPRNHSQYEIDLAILLYELGPYRRQHRPKPCFDYVNFLTIPDNITTMFVPHEQKGGKSREAIIKICGHTLMFDELRWNGRLTHVAALETLAVGKITRTVDAAVTAVKEGKVHIAHETTVGAISHLSRHDYGDKPVFIGPTCKTGNCEILPGNPLYPLICNLHGFNRRVGKDNIATDIDYRHLFKCLCIILCSWMGMLVKGICVNRDLLVLWFERLTNHDWSETSIENLLHPTDAQNVARAVKLLLCIEEIRTIDKDSLIQARKRSSKPNGTSFMSNQLYGDLQAMAKAAILMVAKTKVLDPRNSN
ncbi:hypothetical protein B0H13DRAFT_1882393 [Mycena leptocephala]|nr:hypothetical protein B0H13DRAFT_1882393 [Mycena leptocephala]